MSANNNALHAGEQGPEERKSRRDRPKRGLNDFLLSFNEICSKLLGEKRPSPLRYAQRPPLLLHELVYGVLEEVPPAPHFHRDAAFVVLEPLLQLLGEDRLKGVVPDGLGNLLRAVKLYVGKNRAGKPLGPEDIGVFPGRGPLRPGGRLGGGTGRFASR
jgi:hypothetical protein